MRKPDVSKLKAIKSFPAGRWFTYSDVSHLGWLRATFSARISHMVREGLLKRRTNSKRRAEFYISENQKKDAIKKITTPADLDFKWSLFYKFMRA